MLLNRVLVIEHLMVPVSIAVVDPLLLTVTYLFYSPWSVRMLGLVIDTCKHLSHIVIVVSGILLTSVSLPELVDCINRPVTSCLIVS